VCSYALSTSFRVDASGRRIAEPPTHGMEAAERYYHARDYDETQRCCRELIAQDEHHFDALHLLGVVHLDCRRLQEATDCLTRAVRERPEHSLANYHLGSALLELRQFDQAEAALRQALAGRADEPGTLNNLGNALIELGRHDEALACFEHVLCLQPKHVPALYNAGRSLAELDRLEEAVSALQSALSTAPVDTSVDRLADIHSALAQALAALGHYDEALVSCRAIAAIKPGVGAWNESLVLLLLGNFADGWPRYESRWDVPDHDRLRADARVPTLAEVAGKRVLLVPEQGHGDMIQFARYAPMLAAEGARVTLQTYIEHKALMQTLEGIDAVISREEAEPASDYVTPLLSLPLMFGTNLSSIPAQVPYLHAPPERLAIWRERLGVRTQRRIGLAWWGSQHIRKRSLSIDALQPLLSFGGFEFHSLQKTAPATHPALIDHGAELNDFADTAALISLLDLVVTIDTSVAHLAGALGMPVWIMLKHDPDWRWLLDRDDSPWYPTARLFRQRQRGDWGAVIAAIVAALRQLQAPARR
jgi:tetratricopeptide (TPR) repeat protein